MTQKKKKAVKGANEDILALEEFLPYRLSVLTNLVSSAIAREYSSRYSLSIAEWRVMAALGRFPGLSAVEVAERTAMDKVKVSRAVASLHKAGRLKRKISAQDRRRSVLSLSAKGNKIYRDIVPRARHYEKALYDSLNSAETKSLNKLITKLTSTAATL